MIIVYACDDGVHGMANRSPNRIETNEEMTPPINLNDSLKFL